MPEKEYRLDDVPEKEYRLDDAGQVVPTIVFVVLLAFVFAHGVLNGYVFSEKVEDDMRCELNNDYKTRNKIIFNEETDVDCMRFTSLPLDKLELLVEKNFIDLEDCQNSSPSVREFLDFMRKYPGVCAHGYTISHKRSDYRVSLEGLIYDGIVSDNQMLKDFVNLCHKADDFSVGDHILYSWWD